MKKDTFKQIQQVHKGIKTYKQPCILISASISGGKAEINLSRSGVNDVLMNILIGTFNEDPDFCSIVLNAAKNYMIRSGNEVLIKEFKDSLKLEK